MSHFGNCVGLVSNERHERVLEKYKAVEKEIERLETTFLPPSDALKKLLESHDMPNADSGISLASLLRRPEITYSEIAALEKNQQVPVETGSELPADVQEQVEISIKYDGYIKRQQRQLDELKRMENHKIPEDIDYESIKVLRIEARQKLNAVRPLNLGQATRISGVSPADAAALMVYLKNR